MNELHKADEKQARHSRWPKSERYEKQILAFEAADKTSPPPQDGMFFTDASNIVGWKSLAEDFPGLPVINRGFSQKKGSSVRRQATWTICTVLSVRLQSA